MRDLRARFLQRMRVSLLLSILLSLVCSGAASAACLLADYSTRAEYNRSEAVLVGSVLSDRNMPESDKTDTPGGTFYLVRNLETFRGTLGRTVEIFSENSSGRLPMRMGTSYLLFLYRQQGVLSADSCGNSGRLANKAGKLREVRQLAKSKHSS